MKILKNITKPLLLASALVVSEPLDVFSQEVIAQVETTLELDMPAKIAYLDSIKFEGLSYDQAKSQIMGHLGINSDADFMQFKDDLLDHNYVFEIAKGKTLTVIRLKLADYQVVNTAAIPSFSPFSNPQADVPVKYVVSDRSINFETKGLTRFRKGNKKPVVILNVSYIEGLIEKYKLNGIEFNADMLISNTIINELAHYVFFEGRAILRNLQPFTPQFAIISELYSDYIMLKFGHYQSFEAFSILHKKGFGAYQMSHDLMTMACKDVLGYVPSSSQLQIFQANERAIISRFLQLAGTALDMVQK